MTRPKLAEQSFDSESGEIAPFRKVQSRRRGAVPNLVVESLECGHQVTLYQSQRRSLRRRCARCPLEKRGGG